MNEKIKEYWERQDTKSMYDRNLLDIEISYISSLLRKEDVVLEVGCGDGTTTSVYRKSCKKIIGVDFSRAMIKKARNNNEGVEFIQDDISNLGYIKEFDVVISQRCLINLNSWELQKKAINIIHCALKNKGTFIMLEGFCDGLDKLNKVRGVFQLEPIRPKWHNLFFKEKKLKLFMNKSFRLAGYKDISVYFLLTRAFNAALTHPEIPKWNSRANKLAKDLELSSALPELSNKGFGGLRLCLWKKI